MVKFMKGALLAGVASFALASVAAAAPVLTDAEFKCQTSVSKAGSKFVGSKAKCASKCIANARKVPPVNPVADCYAPYGGATEDCIVAGPIPGKSAEEKFNAAILKICDPLTKITNDCPECYSGGDCVSEAGDRVQNVEGNVDNFGPGVFCEQPGADKLENSCEANTAKTLVKLVGSINKCHDKCHSNERKGLIPAGSCSPAITPADGVTLACLNAARGKAVAGVNKKCRTIGESAPGANDGTTAVPDCFGVDTNDYPDGSTWVTLVDGATNGQVPGTYCSSPSGSFLN
jgi:hypothetical protein